jgi:hypothetical protein
MSLKPALIQPVPDETARIAKAACKSAWNKGLFEILCAVGRN